HVDLPRVCLDGAVKRPLRDSTTHQCVAAHVGSAKPPSQGKSHRISLSDPSAIGISERPWDRVLIGTPTRAEGGLPCCRSKRSNARALSPSGCPIARSR